MCSQTPETTRMLQLISGFQVSRALFVASRLGLPDHIESGPRSMADLAKASGTDADALLRLIRVLTSVGVFSLDSEQRVQNTALSRTLLSEARHSLRGWAIGQLGDEHYAAWGALEDSVRSGGLAFQRVFGQSPWSYRSANPERAAAFDAGMSSYLSAHHDALLASFDFKQFAHIADIGGGDGQLMAALLSADDRLSGVLLEQPQVIEKARARFERAALTARCELIAGSMFDAVPAGLQTYCLSRVIHDWDDEQALLILRCCHGAAAPGASLLLIERLLPDPVQIDPQDQAVSVSDLNMLVMTGGRERTRDQYRALLDAAGWGLKEIRTTGTSLSVLQALRR